MSTSPESTQQAGLNVSPPAVLRFVRSEDAGLRLIAANSVAASLLPACADCIGKRSEDVLAPFRDAGLAAWLGDVAAGAQGRDTHARAATLEGRTIAMHAYGMAGGEVLLLLRDAEAAADHAFHREMMEKIAESAVLGVMWFTEDGTLLHLNDIAVRMLGVQPAAVIGRNVWDLHRLANQEAWRREWERLASGESVSLVMPQPGDRERRRHMHLTAHPVELRGVRYLLAFTQDITERTDMESALRETEGLYSREISERRRSEQLEQALYQISQAAISSDTLDDLYRSVHRIISQLLPAENFFIAMYDAQHDLLSFPYFVDQYDEAYPTAPPGRGLTEYVLRSGKPLLVTGESFQEMVARGEVDLFGTDSVDWLGVPLKSEDRTIGVMVVQSYTEGVRFYQRELDIMTFVSSQIAMAFDRKQAEHALRESEGRLRQIIDLVPHFIFAKDAEGRFLMVNKAVADAYGTTVEQLAAKTDADFAHSLEEARHFREDDLDVIERGQPKLIDECITDARGDVHLLQTVKIPFSISGQDGKAVLGVSIDITERKRAEASLTASEQRYRVIAEQTGQLIYDLDIASGAIAWAGSIEAITGFTPSQFAGVDLDGWEALIHPDDRAAAINLLNDAMAQGTEYYIEYRFRRRDGSFITVEDNGIFLRDHAGRVHRMLGAMKDISERKEAEERLRRSEEYYRSLIENSSDVITVADGNGFFRYVSPSVTRIFGYRPEQIIGANVYGFMHPEEREETRAAFRKVFLGATLGRTQELRLQHRDGHWLSLEIIGRLIQDEAGEQAVIVNARDITERKAVEEEMLRAKERAERSDRLKDAFIANMSHEIRTPLNIMMGYANILLEEFGPTAEPSMRMFLERIQNGGQRLMRTVDMILTISRMQVGDVRLQADWHDLVPLLQRLVAEFRIRAAEKGLALDFACELPDAVLHVDEYYVTQALSNLLENAIKYTAQGSVTLRLYAGRDGGVCVDVTDTGIGIAAEYLPHLFEPYSQEDSGYSRAYEGLGLGLALVKKYLDLHKAGIEVFSTKGEGTTFTIAFPRGARSAQPAQPGGADAGDAPHAHPAAAGAGAVRPAVLVVEDDMDSLHFMRTILASEYTVHSAESASTTWDVLTRLPVDLILMDISLTGPKDGLQLTREIRADARYAGIPIIAVTAHAFENDRERSLAAGCSDYLTKPFKTSDLLARMRELLA